MPRYEVYHEDYGLAFGDDRACGEFLQIWKRPKDPEERRLQDTFGMNPEEVLVDEDRHTQFSKEKMLTLIAEYGFSIDELKQKKGMY